MRHTDSTHMFKSDRMLITSTTLRLAFFVVGVYVAANAGAQCGGQGFPHCEESATKASSPQMPIESSRGQLTLGRILDKGAQKMSSAQVREAVAAGRFGLYKPYGGIGEASYGSDGTMTGYVSAYGMYIYGEWKVDDRGRLCLDGYGGWSDTRCYYWFRLDESMYLLPSESDSDREKSVVELKPL